MEQQGAYHMSIASQFTGADTSKKDPAIASRNDLLLASFSLLGVDGRKGGTADERAAVRSIQEFTAATGGNTERVNAWAKKVLTPAATQARVAKPGSVM
jgi:hypothetical protein